MCVCLLTDNRATLHRQLTNDWLEVEKIIENFCRFEFTDRRIFMK
jgi:hypothetical protein